jgi:hypothetical protein
MIGDETVTRNVDEKLGYDLLVMREDDVLYVIVKGQIDGDLTADFTQTEYRAIRNAEKGRFPGRYVYSSFRICLVMDAMNSGELYEFQYCPSENHPPRTWSTAKGDHTLKFDELVTASASVSGR